MTAIPTPIHDPAHDTSHAHGHGHEHAHAHDVPFLGRYIFSMDHKIIGIQFLFLGLMFMVLGGLLAMLVRWQLAYPDNPQAGLVGKAVPILGSWLGWTNGMMPPDFYNSAFTMHASIMIFFAIIPLVVGYIGNYLVPLQIGAPDMQFPFLNGLAFWSSVPAGSVMIASFMLTGGSAAAGWTSYPPLSALLPAGAETAQWPMAAVLLTYASWFVAFAYVGYYYIRLGNRYVNGAVNLVLSLVVAIYFTRFTQKVAPDGQAAWFLSLILLGFTSLMGVINYITTIIKLRAPGMTMFRMPLTTWAIFITSILVLLSTPVLASALSLNLLDHNRLTSFFLPGNWTVSKSIQVTDAGWAPGGGFPILHQHLFWFYSHPAVYIMILPTMGVASDILACFSRKPVFGYRPMVYAIAGIAFLGFIVWAHHMFQSGMNPTLGTTFAVSTMFIAVPSAIKTFNWLGTLWRGNITFNPAMLFALGFVSMFVIGGLSGIFMASTAVDVHIHDTYFIVAHIHYVLFGGSIMGVLMSIYFWYPKMFGRMMNNRLGVIHFILTFTFMNLVFFPMHMIGIHGMPRRVHDYTQYEMFMKFVGLNRMMSWAAFALMASQILVIINFFGSWFWGAKAPQNPWNASTLEWCAAPTPPPHGNFLTTPVVHHGPYEYSSPLVEEDYLPQTRYVEGAEKMAHVGH